jgi:hypothetical protein
MPAGDRRRYRLLVTSWSPTQRRPEPSDNTHYATCLPSSIGKQIESLRDT